MGITPSTLCCCHPPEKDASDPKKKEQNIQHRRGCPEATSSLCCPKAPLEPVKPTPLLSRVHLLVGCNNIEEHNRKIRHALHVTENLHGKEGLRALGLEYQRFACIEHQELLTKKESSASLGGLLVPFEGEGGETTKTVSQPSLGALQDRVSTGDTDPCSIESLPETSPQFPSVPLSSFPMEHLDANASADDVSSQGATNWGDDDETDDMSYHVPLKREDSDDKDAIGSTSSVIGTGDHLTVAESVWEGFTPESFQYCLNCRRKLVLIETGALITPDNRADYIADGIMYDRIADFCQEVAQEAMCEDYNLEWTQVAPASHQGQRAEIRAIVSKHADDDDDDNETTGTIIIVTGRGVVKAGIFSRQALVCGEGLEIGSAWHLLREASLRHMKVIMPDPNCRGDRWGYDVIRQSLRKLWPEDPSEDVYMVIHSAGGSNVQRFFLDTAGTSQTHLPQIKAMALTDSTHNLQWSKREPEWLAFWESDRVIYFKSAQTLRDADGSRWYLHAAGTPIQTDSFWHHRFGKVRTCNAGTDIHAMTNWFAHQPIWKHLDQYWKPRQQERQEGRFLPDTRGPEKENGQKASTQESQ
mmetsp:Transcript_6631/g.13684  ORF Transcript_6631/g.13684 Transcript_6631/m.13684 type:complete len:586 (-) Transcript_6631:2127-3884(-)